MQYDRTISYIICHIRLLLKRDTSSLNNRFDQQVCNILSLKEEVLLNAANYRSRELNTSVILHVL